MAWKTYAWGMLGLAAATIAGRFAMFFRRSGSASAWDLWEALFNLLLLPGLFGLAYRRAYLTRVFWEAVVPLAWAAFVYSPFSPTHLRVVREKGMWVAVIATVVSSAVNVPGMLAITLYAYWRPDIWR